MTRARSIERVGSIAIAWIMTRKSSFLKDLLIYRKRQLLEDLDVLEGCLKTRDHWGQVFERLGEFLLKFCPVKGFERLLLKSCPVKGLPA